jgi:hypothetical protein
MELRQKEAGKVLKKNKSYKIEIQYKFEGNFPAIYIGMSATR